MAKNHLETKTKLLSEVLNKRNSKIEKIEENNRDMLEELEEKDMKIE